MDIRKIFRIRKRKNINLKKIEITFLGYSFKENCSDIRNTKVKDLIYLIKDMGIKVALWDPMVDLSELRLLEEDGIHIYLDKPNKIEFAFLCVNHDEINNYLESYDGLVFDYKNIDFN